LGVNIEQEVKSVIKSIISIFGMLSFIL
jgi:hypothetical protein